MFGSNNTSSGGLFAPKSTFAQSQPQFQQQQQQQQQPQQLFQQQQQQQSIPEKESMFSKYKLNSSKILKEPEWVRNSSQIDIGSRDGTSSSTEPHSQIKKRSLPTHLMKRSNQSTDHSSEDLDSVSTPVIPFNTIIQNKRLNGANDDDIFQDEIYQDKLPSRSLFDLNSSKDDENSNNISINSETFKNLESNPNEFRNAFNRYERTKFQSNGPGENKQNLPFVTSQGGLNSNSQSNTNNKNDTSEKELTSLESAVLVFGYDDSCFNLMVEHFSKFGVVLENFSQETKPTFSYHMNPYQQQHQHQQLRYTDFSASGTTSNVKPQKSCPIFIGDRWMKITYDNPSSAIRALCENNSLDEYNNVIGVIPYTKKNLEKLLKFEIPESQDIGGSVAMVNINSQERVVNNEMSKIFGGAVAGEDSVQGSTNLDTEFKLKDGTGLINVTKSKKKAEKTGFIDGSIKFIFGKGEL
ncbi:hypothetical protein CANARDRAFT_8118 [[Candida] arabinofermentans NRRL YB-2248]|uniref:RRM Nup35-type domain-containing protein n=1 Tax=[Candida] arabinofermentans NRRL YB-2248 TaxID=983967 RepID=A0A1E4SZN9_9ASCO|nr:hypothetical protein CANARDRAFT_8118 [[Candida] arabinofermentans NRRL YB-2248]